MSSPGIAVDTIIECMTQEALRRLLGDDLINTLHQLSDASVSVDDLRKVAKTLHGNNNPAAIQSENVRSQLIDALPIEKARELSAKLDMPPKGDIYTHLKQFLFGRKRDRDEIFLTFFGVVQNATAPLVRQPTIAEIEPSYGLFDYQRDVALRTLRALHGVPYKALLHMPTGAGKTRTAMHIIARHLHEKGPTLVCWLANNRELLDQAADEMEKSWKTLGDRPVTIYRFWGDRTVDLKDVHDGVLVASFAKMHAAYLKEQNSIIALGDRWDAEDLSAQRSVILELIEAESLNPTSLS